MSRYVAVSMFFIFALFISASATIISIPVDQPTIQQGIDVSSDGDTVLVQPGTYVENINFGSHIIVLASLFLTTGDTTYISNTIIDGDTLNSVIILENGVQSITRITGFTIQNGYGDPHGGGIYCAYTHAHIANNIITGNIGSAGGGIYFGRYVDILIEKNKITENSASRFGGAIYSFKSNPEIINNIITENTAQESGGGIHCRYSSATINNNTITDNEAIQTNGGGIVCNESFISGANNIINNNSANSFGGGLYCEHSNAIFTNTVFYGNSSAENGGGIACINSCPMFINTIIWANAAVSAGDNIYADVNSMPKLSFCDIEGGWSGDGNIDTDPLFKDPENGDFHLMAIKCGDMSNSPCIDMGNPVILDSLVDCFWGLNTSLSDIGAYGGGAIITQYPGIIYVPADYPTIQEAINNSFDGDTVLVSPGTYIENISFNGHSIVLGSMFLTTGDTSYVSSTIIDGGSLGTVIDLRSGEDSTTAIIGLTIQNGFTENYGAGIWCQHSDPRIRHNRIIDNNAAHQGTSGGGIRCHYSNVEISDNLISGNSADAGGGINCAFCSIIISNNIISSNESEVGGGLKHSGCNIEIANNTFVNNTSIVSGGAIFATSSRGCQIHDNYFTGNSTGNLFGGGAIICTSNDTVTSNIIIGNSTTGAGGGIRCEGRAFIANNIIAYNTAFTGGGIWFGDPATLTGNTIIGNSAEYAGNAIACQGVYCDAIIKNNICWHNGSDEIAILDNAQPAITYCNIENGFAGEGNIDCDPVFCNAADADYHLSDASCCAGAGEGGVDIGAMGVGCYASVFLKGDVNMYNGQWPPTVVGGDVTYLVNYFRSLPASQPCLLGGFWASADANGDCLIIGSDVTRLVNCFRGDAEISWCPDYAPAWPIPDDLPVEAPEGWPNCEESEAG
ncbi:MAG: hypothetical protein GY839_10280 [candidate division Zixibacteria bacterium]|nr:hypothetical protein [candidate division Zixibacteria bacterium]